MFGKEEVTKQMDKAELTLGKGQEEKVVGFFKLVDCNKFSIFFCFHTMSICTSCEMRENPSVLLQPRIYFSIPKVKPSVFETIASTGLQAL